VYYRVLWGCTFGRNLFRLKIRRLALQIRTRSYINLEHNTRVISSATCPAVCIYTDTVFRTANHGLWVNAFKQHKIHSVVVQNLAPGNEADFTRFRKFAKCDCQYLRVCTSVHMEQLFSRCVSISLNLIFCRFYNNLSKNSSFIKMWQK